MSKTKTAQAAPLEQLQSAGVGVARATAWLQRECESAGRNGGFNAEGDLANIIRTGNSLRGWLIGLRDALETKGIRASLRAANPDAAQFADEVGESYLEAIFLAGERNFITLSMLCRHGMLFDYLSHLLPQSAVTLKGDIEPIPLWAPLPAPESIEYVKGTGGALRTPAFLVGRIFQEIGELPRVNADHATRFINKELERLRRASASHSGDEPLGANAGAVLEYLSKADGEASQDKIAKRCKKSRGTVRDAIGVLEKRGFAGTPEGRRYGTAITDSGRQYLIDRGIIDPPNA